jgi:hypothetical protein
VTELGNAPAAATAADTTGAAGGAGWVAHLGADAVFGARLPAAAAGAGVVPSFREVGA